MPLMGLDAASGRMKKKSRYCARQCAVLATVCSLLLFLLLSVVHMPLAPASSSTRCSSRHLTQQADPDHLTLYFEASSPRPVSKIVSRFLLQPAAKTCASRLDLLILVPSPPEAVQERETVRKTWGSVVGLGWPQARTSWRVGLVFLLGRRDTAGDSVVPTALVQEAVTHGDLLLGDFVDSYRNLTQKILAGLNWVSQSCAGRVSYVLKADQDTFIHVDLLLDTVFRLQGNQPMTHTILGELLCSEPVNRDPDARIYVDSAQYPFATYPPYVRGGSYVLSGSLVTPLVNASQHLPVLPVEDAFITGVLAHRLHVRHIHVPGVMKGQACSLSPCLFFGTGQVSATSVDRDMMVSMWQQVVEGMHHCHQQASWWTATCVWLGNRLS